MRHFEPGIEGGGLRKSPDGWQGCLREQRFHCVCFLVKKLYRAGRLSGLAGWAGLKKPLPFILFPCQEALPSWLAGWLSWPAQPASLVNLFDKETKRMGNVWAS